MIHTGSFLHEPSYYINEYPIYEVDNVLSIDYHHRLFDKTKYPFGWDLEVDSDSNRSEHIYFYIDTLFQDAFSHWVFESGIYLILFKELKNKYPTIKLLFKEIKNYKKIFFNVFNIHEQDYTTTFIPKSKVLFPTYQSCHIFFENYTDSNDTILDKNYIHYLENFRNVLIKIQEKDIDILYLPRAVKENYVGNNRIINIQEDLKKYISTIPNSYILDTDTVTDIKDQINLIQRSKNIIMDYGSSYLVNSFFADNSNIIVLSFDIHHIMQKILKMVCDLSKEKNKNVFFIKEISKEGNQPIYINFNLDDVIKGINIITNYQ